MYLDNQGNEITRDQIEAAVAAGSARIIRSYGINHIKSSLTLDGIDRDTRGQTYQMSEAVWTQTPESLGEALQVAYARV